MHGRQGDQGGKLGRDGNHHLQINAIFGKIMHTLAKLDCISELKKHTFKVWRHNLHEEMLAICQLVAQFPFVAMDTEFPGTIDNPNTQTHTWTQSTLDHPNRLGNIHRHRHGRK